MTAGERLAAAEALDPTSRRICLDAGTEPPFFGSTVNGYRHDNKADGVYVCALGGLPLFDSMAKFESGTGYAWASMAK
jgi:peptide-methionine (R)-S-oxide reductase